jgi:hypothetical protein
LAILSPKFLMRLFSGLGRFMRWTRIRRSRT